MTLATPADVEEWLGRSLTLSESERVNALLIKAEGLVAAYLGCSEAPDPVPDLVRITVAEMVARLFTTAAAPGIQQISADDGSVMYTANASSASPYLTKADKLALRPYRCSGGLMSVQFVGSRYGITP